MFVTDETHKATLQRQLADTEQLIARTTTDFQQRHGTPMPDDNVWLARRRAEQATLTQLLSIMDTRARPSPAGRWLRRHRAGSDPAHPRYQPHTQELKIAIAMLASAIALAVTGVTSN